MKKAVDKDTTLVLPVDAELFRLLRDSRARFAGDEAGAAEPRAREVR